MDNNGAKSPRRLEEWTVTAVTGIEIIYKTGTNARPVSSWCTLFSNPHRPDSGLSGHWTKEEEERLTEIVTEMTVQQGKDIDNDIFWGVVSQKMGGTRGRQQCRIKW